CALRAGSQVPREARRVERDGVRLEGRGGFEVQRRLRVTLGGERLRTVLVLLARLRGGIHGLFFSACGVSGRRDREHHESSERTFDNGRRPSGHALRIERTPLFLPTLAHPSGSSRRRPTQYGLSGSTIGSSSFSFGRFGAGFEE